MFTGVCLDSSVYQWRGVGCGGVALCGSDKKKSFKYLLLYHPLLLKIVFYMKFQLHLFLF